MNRKRIEVYVLTSMFILLLASVARTANAPVTTLATIGNVTPGQVSVPVTVQNFTSIGAISLSFDYNYSALHFVQGTPNPSLASASIFDNDLGNGKHRVIMGWYNNNAVTLANGSTVLTVVFTYISGNDSLLWYDDGPSCEYADGLGIVLNDIPASTYYINGFICGSMGSPGMITGISSVCQGQTGVLYSISPMPNITGYSWTVPPGAVITGGAGTNSVTVDFPPGAASGNVAVNGINPCGTSASSSLFVVVNVLPVANAGNDTTILYGTVATLHAVSGGTGSFSYHWSPESLLVNPDVQNPQTVILTSSTVFTVLVTNTVTTCQNSDQAGVTISGGPLTANPTVYPAVICRGESAQLYANAGGGSGNYTYSWTCMPAGMPVWTSNLPNPVVIPDSSKVYHLSVYDGFNTSTGNAALTVYQLPSALITGGDTLCGTGLTTTLTVALTGTPPWSFDYSDGLTTYSVTGQNTSPYLIITAVPGVYTVSSLMDDHCNGPASGSAVVAVFPIPATPVITQSGNELMSTACCGNQWYKDQVAISGATAQSFLPDETGHYMDIVTLSSCPSDTSNDIYYVVDGMSSNPGIRVIIYPNPAHDQFWMQLPKNLLQDASFEIYSSEGMLVKKVLPGSPVERGTYEIGIGDFIPGLYLVLVKSAAVILTAKLLVK